MIRPLLAVIILAVVLPSCTPAPRYQAQYVAPQASYAPPQDPYAEVRQSSLEIARLMSEATEVILKKSGEEKTVAVSLEAARDSMKDPAATQFRNVRLVAYSSGHLVCGELNGKNSYGAYTGFKPFIASPIKADIYHPERRPNSERARNAGIIEACGL